MMGDKILQILRRSAWYITSDLAERRSVISETLANASITHLW
jgi:hypothetical protein